MRALSLLFRKIWHLLKSCWQLIRPKGHSHHENLCYTGWFQSTWCTDLRTLCLMPQLRLIWQESIRNTPGWIIQAEQTWSLALTWSRSAVPCSIGSFSGPAATSYSLGWKVGCQMNTTECRCEIYVLVHPAAQQTFTAWVKICTILKRQQMWSLTIGWEITHFARTNDIKSMRAKNIFLCWAT